MSFGESASKRLRSPKAFFCLACASFSQKRARRVVDIDIEELASPKLGRHIFNWLRLFFGCLTLGAVTVTPSWAADTAYTYDALGRLAGVTYSCGGSATYAYDAVGNRTTTSATPNTCLPVAVGDTATTAANSPVTLDPRANDHDPSSYPLTIIAIGTARHGTALINSGISITYTPITDYSGTDSFSYSISDGHGGTASATVTVTVTP